MNRRQFLRTGPAVGAAVALGARGLVAAEPRGGGGGAVGAAGVVPATAETVASGPGLKAVAGRRAAPKFLLSCAAYSFRAELQAGKMSLEEFVDLCARHDLEGTELTSYYFTDTSPAYLASLRRRAYVNGLSISGTPVGNNFCFPAGEKRDGEVEKVKQWINHVARLGSQTIRVFAGRAPNGVSDDQASEWAIEGLKVAAEYAGERGVILALENHGGITATAEQLLALVRGVDSPWLGVNLDTGNFHQDPYGSLEKAAPYAVSVQVKVEVSERGKQKEPADFARITGILRRANYRGFVALEYEAREPAAEAVPRYLAKLRAALAG